MDRKINGTSGPSSSVDGGASIAPPNYSFRAVQVALQHLASIDLIELCNEAKVERCRATRDLRSCGRHVESALNSCGHASLCEECSKRCDLCPICRARISKEENGVSLHPRLFYECIDAGLISKTNDDRFQEKEEEDDHITADVQHLYCLFDVALENNLASLICHYVTDVCMDESAVSSDPVVAFLLDEVVVKDWCKRAFGNIIAELQGIYNLEAKEMKSRLNKLLKHLAHLGGISNVLAVLESSFKDSLSAQLHDLQFLQESILKTKQHMEIMIWCMRHDFLANVRSRHTNVTSWRSHVRELKAAAIRRAWPDAINNSEESVKQEGSLFIEDALSNLEVEQGYSQEMGEELKIAYLHKDGISTIFRSKIEGVACYPFESLRTAIDILFLHGSSDMVLAKQAIFLYFLYDRHWTIPDEEWKHILEDFAASFGITRYLLLESLIFFLLDDLTEEAIQRACEILPEISGPSTHPKIAQVLLEIGNPDEALMLLRCSGRDGTSHPVSISEAVTAVRVRVECGLLTEVFLHQRMLCTKVREKKYGPSDDSQGDNRDWKYWIEVLVTEICFLCIRRNMVDRMIELPWNSDEEKHLHKCLLDYATDDLSSTVGSLLVVFYIQRYRYTQAYQVDLILKKVEQEFMAKNSASEEVFSTMRSVSGLRAGLVEKCMALLPEIRRQEVLAGTFPESSDTTNDEVERNVEPDSPAKSVSLLIPSSNDSSVPPWTDHKPLWKPLFFETPLKKPGSFENHRKEMSNHGLTGRLYNSAERKEKPQASAGKHFKFGNKSLHRATPVKPSPFKDANQTPYRVFPSNNLRDGQSDRLSPEGEARRFVDELDSETPYFNTFTANPIATPSSKYNVDDFQPSVNSKRVHPERDERQWNVPSSDDLMDVSWSNVNKDFASGDVNVTGGSRWRSDETSDDEDEPSSQIALGTTYRPTPFRGVRRSRFA